MPKPIRYSVGRGGRNTSPQDVFTVQYLLNCVPCNQGGPMPELAVDGIAGPKTVAAIMRFQRGCLAFPDGRVDPGGPTLARLQQFDPFPFIPIPPMPMHHKGDKAYGHPGHKGGYKQTGPPGYKDATPPGYKDYGHPGHKGGYKQTGPPGYKDATPPGYKDYGHPGHKGGYKETGPPGYKDATPPGHKDYGHPGHKGGYKQTGPPAKGGGFKSGGW